MESPRDARLVVVLTFLKAFSIWGKYDEKGWEISFDNFERAYLHLVGTLDTRNKNSTKFQILGHHDRYGRNEWLRKLLAIIAECELFDLRENGIVLRQDGREKYDGCLSEFSNLALDEKQELERVAHIAVKYYHTRLTNPRPKRFD